MWLGGNRVAATVWFWKRGGCGLLPAAEGKKKIKGEENSQPGGTRAESGWFWVKNQTSGAAAAFGIC